MTEVDGMGTLVFYCRKWSNTPHWPRDLKSKQVVMAARPDHSVGHVSKSSFALPWSKVSRK